MTRCRSRLYIAELDKKVAKTIFHWLQRMQWVKRLEDPEDMVTPQMSLAARVRRGCGLMLHASGKDEPGSQLVHEAIRLFSDAKRDDLAQIAVRITRHVPFVCGCLLHASHPHTRARAHAHFFF